MNNLFFGKYRGKVIANQDPQQRGRIQVQVASVLGDITTAWAMPAEPYAGPKVGFYAIPPVGANVWVEFEGGDHTLPVWTGNYWTKQEDVPLSPAGPDVQVFRTPAVTIGQNNISGDSGDGGNPKSGDVELKQGFTIQVGSPIVDGFLNLFMGTDGLIEINNNGEEIIQMNQDNIKIDKNDQSIITLTKENIDLTTSPTQIQMESQSNTIKINNSQATITLNDQGIDSNIGSADVKLTEENVQISYGGATVTLSPEGINLSYGAASVNLSAASVSVNDGALEVI